MKTSRCCRKLLVLGLLLGIILLGPLQAGSTDPPTMVNLTFFGDSGDQAGTAISINNGAIYVGANDAGSNASAHAYVMGYNLSTFTWGSWPDWWKVVDSGTSLNDLTATTAGLYAAGSNYSLSTDNAGGKEVKSFLANFPTDGSAGAGPESSTWFTTPNFFAYTGTEMFNAVATMETGGGTYIYATGFGEPNSYSAFDVAKFYSSGTVMTSATEYYLGIAFDSYNLPGPGGSSGSAITTADGLVYCAGNSSFEDGTSRPVLWVYDDNLNYVNRNRTADISGSLAGLTAYNGALYAVGSATVSGSLDYLIQKYDTSGNLLWSQTYGGTGNEELTGVVGLGNQLYAVGYTTSSGSGGKDAALLGIDPTSGALLSTTLFGGAQDDQFNGVAAYGASLYTVGESRSYMQGGNVIGENDIMLLQYDVPGVTLGYAYDFVHMYPSQETTPIQLSNLSVGPPPNAPAVGYNAVDISNNTFADSFSQTNANGQTVWQATDPLVGTSEIYYYDNFNPTATPQRITTNTFNDTNPTINDNGLIAWQTTDPAVGNSEIYYYDTRNLGGGIHTITNAFNDSYAKINNNGLIVWEGASGDLTTKEIYYYNTYNPGGGVHPITTNSFYDGNPQINANGVIVWSSASGSGFDTWEIKYYDTVNPGGGIHPITSNSFSDGLPQINANGQIVWQGAGGTGGTNEIYYYDIRYPGNGIRQITNNGLTNWDPRINANGQIVWYGGSDSGGYEIYYYDARLIPTETVHRLTNNSITDLYPNINSSGQIVWFGGGYNDGTQEIYYYDLRISGETVHRVTNNGYNDSNPQITNMGQIVYTGNGGDSGTAEIYLATSAGSVQSTPQTNDHGQTVWSAWTGDNYDIFLYSDGQVRQLTYDDYGRDNLYPWINNNGQIAYSSWGDNSLRIVIYDLNTGSQQWDLTGYGGNQYYPMIDDMGRITYLETPGFTGDNHTHYKPTEMSEVWLYDPNYNDPNNPQNHNRRIATNNWTSVFNLNRPVINIAGQVVYTGWDNGTTHPNIYRFDSASGATTQLTFDGGNITPWIDDMGDVAYAHHDGNDNEIYLLMAGNPVPQQMTNNTVNDMNPVIVYGSLIAWNETTANGTNDIYLFNSGLTYNLTNNSFYDSAPMMNQDGQVTWVVNSQVYRLDIAGDRYKGTVIVPTTIFPDPNLPIPGFPYHPSGRSDVYFIVGNDPTPITDPSLFGKVYVDNYYDAESGDWFTPDHAGTPVGTSYLGSEQDGILNTGISQQAFGGLTGLEADVPVIKYNFTYHYGNGDYYSGTVYAAANYYYEGWRQARTDESGNGFYHIDGVADWAVANGLLGQVMVDRYYDTDTQATYYPLHAGAEVGSNYLGSEADWIIAPGVPQFYFGKGYYEAVVTVNDSFTYRQLTDNAYNDNKPWWIGLDATGQPSNGYLYSGSDGHDDEIYQWLNGASIPITNNNYDDEMPIMVGSKFFWTGYDGAHWQIFSSSSPGGTVTPITTEAFDHGYSPYSYLGHDYLQGISSNGTWITWVAGETGAKNLYRYNANTGVTEQLTTNGGGTVDNDYAVMGPTGAINWSVLSESGARRDVYFYDPSKPADQRIINLTGAETYARNNYTGPNNQVVWAGTTNTDTTIGYDIYLYTPSTGVTQPISSSNPYNDRYPKINAAGQMTWQGFDGNNWQIFLYSDGVTTQITSGSNDNMMPRIMANGMVYYNGFDGTHWQVYAYVNGATQQVSYSDFDVREFSVFGSGGTLSGAVTGAVWSEFDGQDYELYRAIQTPEVYTTSQLSQGINNNYFPYSNNGGQVAWYGGPTGGLSNQIYLYEDNTAQLIPTPGGASSSDIGNINKYGQMAWAGLVPDVGNPSASHWQVFYYDGVNVQKLTSGNVDSGHSAYTVFGQTRYMTPIISNTGEIVWAGGPADNKDVYLYDIATATTRNITNPNGTDTVNDDIPWIASDSGDLVWMRGSAAGTTPNREAYYYDHATQIITPITSDSLDERQVRISKSGDVVTFTAYDYTSSKGDIYLWHPGGPAATNISASPTVDDSWSRLNDSGQVVWQGAGSNNIWQIFLYDGTVQPLTSAFTNQLYPRINKQGEVVWMGYNGHDFDIYLYEHGLTTQISSNTKDDILPYINDLGQITWEGKDANNYSQIFLAVPTTVTSYSYRVTNNTNRDDKDVAINANGQLVWSGWDGSDYEIYSATYDPVTNTYPIITQITNNSLNDYEPRINKWGDIVYGEDIPSRESKVYYHSHLTAPGGPDIFIANGNNPDINDAGQIIYKTWTGSYNEADAPSGTPTLVAYQFNYHYSNGDDYWGTVYAPAGTYLVGQPFGGGTDQNGQTGSYYIQSNTNNNNYPSYPNPVNGQVYVNGYFDSETGWQYSTWDTSHPLLSSAPAGATGLGSESGYIAATGNSAYAFGKIGGSYREADVPAGPPTLVAYQFNYNYANGDNYWGTVYAPDGYYTVRQQIAGGLDENGQMGNYQINWKHPIANYYPSYPNPVSGQVYVEGYHDSETRLQYSIWDTSYPLLENAPAGANYLGSESGYLASTGDPVNAFGKIGGSYYEADVPSGLPPLVAYQYSYTYGNGDNYSGVVFAMDGYYTVGQKIFGGVDQNGQVGSYHINGTTTYTSAQYPNAGNGQVYVDGYIDFETGFQYSTGNTSHPLLVSAPGGYSYLGSESGYLSVAGNSAYAFGSLNGGNGQPLLSLYNPGNPLSPTFIASSADESHLNNLGWIAYSPWSSSSNSAMEIYLWQPNGANPPIITRITNNNNDEYCPSINDHGQVVWNRYDGQGYQIFEWWPGMPAGDNQEVSDSGYEADYPRINNYGMVAYTAFDGRDMEVYLHFSNGLNTRLTNNSVDDFAGAINDRGQVAYQELVAPNNSEIFVSSPDVSDAARYNFTFHYADGDWYTGTVIAPLTQLYGEGYKEYLTDEKGQLDYYEITAVEFLYTTDNSQNGRVWVNTYYDHESDQTYTPLSTGSAVGTNYLGSEHSYIVSSSDPVHTFGVIGSTFYEADLAGAAVNRYSFQYTYDNGDYYSGDVYATVADESSLIAIASSYNGYGHYAWVNMASGFAAPANPVQVTAYYDAGTRHSYAASNTAGAFGSETAWFYGAGGSFTFAPTSAVDLVNRYSFVYNYTTSGDSYYGDVYATQAQADAFSQPTSGHYDWMNMAWGFAPLANPANPVRVTAYYDDSSRRLYAASNTTGLFGYETGRFYGAGGSFSFGPASAVDLVNRYGFVYTYNTGGDYYYGDVYATAVQAAAFSQPTSGHYNWMDMASGFAPLAEPANPVRVTAYYDDSSRHMYAVDSTTAALGAETGQFYGYSASFSFSPVSAVDLVNRYTFAYLYNSGGDRYSGQAYATAAQADAEAAFTGHLGHYQFVDMAWGFPSAQPNPVQVTSYYDASSSNFYAVYRNMGTLGGETAWFMSASGYPVNFGVDLEAY